jgi:hypothetical protein
MENHGLILPFKALRDECDALKNYAQDVLDPQTISALDEARSMLENIQVKGSTSRSVRWSIAEERPLYTIWSIGESKPGNQSRPKIRAKFSFVWEIRPIEGKGKKRNDFLLDGLASTRITVVEQEGDGERSLSQWTVDVGDYQSPGTHFHFQFQGLDQPPSASSLDIPRLPAIAMSPFLAIDFTIGELFQDRWREHSMTETKYSNRWRELHRDRLQRFFKWQEQCVKQCTGSPWMALKLAKPPSDLFVRDAR